MPKSTLSKDHVLLWCCGEPGASSQGAFALRSVMAVLCFQKETRNELTGLLWQQDAALTSERKTKVYYDWVKPLIATLDGV